jgi:hypothetical protein
MKQKELANLLIGKAIHYEGELPIGYFAIKVGWIYLLSKSASITNSQASLVKDVYFSSKGIEIIPIFADSFYVEKLMLINTLESLKPILGLKIYAVDSEQEYSCVSLCTTASFCIYTKDSVEEFIGEEITAVAERDDLTIDITLSNSHTINGYVIKNI